MKAEGRFEDSLHSGIKVHAFADQEKLTSGASTDAAGLSALAQNSQCFGWQRADQRGGGVIAGAPADSLLVGGGEGFGKAGEFAGGGAAGGVFAGVGVVCEGGVTGGDSRGGVTTVSGGTSAGAACAGTVGGAAGVTLCTATRTFSMVASTSSSEKLGWPCESLTSTIPFSPSSTF
jgi:hypothetical protein